MAASAERTLPAPVHVSIPQGVSYAAALSQHCTSKVPGLELSRLLGKGGFGSVYCGTWHGAAVAVKMIDVRWVMSEWPF